MSRQSRLAEQIKRELSSVIQMEIRDPRIGMVTLSAVDVSRDLSVAKVYFTVFEQEKIKASKKVLEASEGFLRKKLSSKLSLRSLPRLAFYFDESIERGSRLSALIDDAMEKDKAMSHEEDAQNISGSIQQDEPSEK